MKVHLIRKETLEVYAWLNPQSRGPIEEWLYKIRHSDWKTPEDIKAGFAGADLLGRGSNRVIFNIGGNHYRLIAKYAFGEKQVHLFINWLGTHAEYDRVCNSNEQFTIQKF